MKNATRAIIAVAVVVVIGGVILWASYMTPGYQSSSVYSTPTPTSATVSPVPTSVLQNQTESVSVKNFAFSPATVTIKSGDTVVWTNKDGAMHNVIGDSFGSGNFGKDGAYSHTFTAAGTYNYYCSIHPAMKGAVIVIQ